MKKLRENRLAFVIGMVFLAFGCFMNYGIWGAYTLDSGIVESGERAEGHITGKTMLRSADGDSDFLIDYWFALPDGQRIESHRGIAKALWKTFKIGDVFVVCYSKDKPKRNFPLGSGVTSFGGAIFGTVITTVFALFGALLIAGCFFDIGKKQTSQA